LKTVKEDATDNKYIDWVYARFTNNSNYLNLEKKLLTLDHKNSTTGFTNIIELLRIIKE